MSFGIEGCGIVINSNYVSEETPVSRWFFAWLVFWTL
jgi:hypothetical protein